MGQIKRMDQIRLIISTYLQTGSKKATARRLCISKNTVKNYLRSALESSDDLTALLDRSDEDLRSVFYQPTGKDSQQREQVFIDKLDYWIKELRKTGVTKQLLWEEYKLDFPEGYGYSQYCEKLKREFGRRDLTIRLNHKPGEYMQVDFAGKKMKWVDVSTGEEHLCEVLIAVMPYSQYTFAIALPTQQLPDFVHGLNMALLFFGKLPLVILSDNLKSYVKKSDRYDPEFTELCVQLATHYSLDLKATRVRKPKDKASVENAVKTTYTRINAPIRNEIFYSLEELNQAIRRQLEIHNNRSYQKRFGSRTQIFEQEELPRMRSLPSDLFEVKKITKSKVRKDYHVFIGEEKNFYSVPFQYVGKDSIIIYTTKTVEVFIDNQRIAVHDRLTFKNAYQHRTNEAHMPKSHLEWKKARGLNAAYFRQLAEKIGPCTLWAISQILLSRIHEPQSYNTCHGIFKLAKKYSEQRLELACRRCKKTGKASYSMIRRILQHRLDQVEDQLDPIKIPDHENIRGSDFYQ